jgi:SAM-dependent methyltransferase
MARESLRLFLVGFLVLFLELACIRWFAATVTFLQFFSNVTLIACFLGISCGCMAARARRDWLALFPLLALGTVVAALSMRALYDHWSGLAIDVGNQASPQEVFFGTEYRHPDVATFVVPIELIVAVFFVLIALLFVGLGQTLGKSLDAYPDRVAAYSLNIGGSLAGILGFSALSLAQAPPAVWFLAVAVGTGWLLRETGALTAPRIVALALLPAMVTLPALQAAKNHVDLRWSPYYAVYHDRANGTITVNSIGHQQMVSFARAGSPYSLVHLLQQRSGGPAFHDALVIGAGSGNDLAHALRFGVDRIDAVEIDPVIQSIGFESHPDRPYQDRRVAAHLDDGRHFLRTTDRRYDLVVYALVDSLMLHSGYANIRLESYLFTQEAFADIERVLKPGGVFVTYNFFRQGWIVDRVAAMSEAAFGCKPIVLALPFQETLRSSDPAGFAMVIGGCNERIAAAFAAHPRFELNDIPSKNLEVDGFRTDSASRAAGGFRPIAPATLVRDEGAPSFATDDWPFLYLHGRLIPDLTVRSTLLLGGLGLLLVWLFLRKDPAGIRIDGRMFFLGAAFLLLETRAVVQLALLFGSTWSVNSLVFAAVLVLILLANLYVLWAPPVALGWHYAALLLLLGVGILVPADVFLGGGILWRTAVPCALALGPMFFAGAIFARSFREAADPDQAFGANIAGSVVGGFSESFSMLVGFRYLLLVAVAFYLLSAWGPSLRLGGPRS